MKAAYWSLRGASRKVVHELASVALGRGYENVRRWWHAPKTGAMSVLDRMLDSSYIVSLSYFDSSMSD